MSSGEWSGDDEFECSTCGAVFETERELEQHAESEHSDPTSS
ncbi:C2H2-type zinc finger protein [Halococcus hamelinensis]|jgi:uncharacterized C2H2 Zn-finger protein|nr:C2H2-type zinc finger protein [Halococcus hamelinensis]